jgi:hypothetical protein
MHLLPWKLLWRHLTFCCCSSPGGASTSRSSCRGRRTRRSSSWAAPTERTRSRPRTTSSLCRTSPARCVLILQDNARADGAVWSVYVRPGQECKWCRSALCWECRSTSTAPHPNSICRLQRRCAVSVSARLERCVPLIGTQGGAPIASLFALPLHLTRDRSSQTP